MRALALVAVLACVRGAGLEAADITVGPQDSLAEAISRASQGDRLLLRAGLHRAVAPLRIDKPLRLDSVEGPGAARIEGATNLDAPVLTVAESLVVLVGLGIESSVAGQEAVFCDDAAVWMRNCVVRGEDRALRLDALHAEEGTPIESMVLNCIVEGEAGLGGVAILHDPLASPLVRNSIVLFWGAGVQRESGRGEGVATIDYSDFYRVVTAWPDGQLGDTNLLEVVPNFVDPAGWDYRLRDDATGRSPLIDQGHPDEAYADGLETGGGDSRADLGIHGGPPLDADFPVVAGGGGGGPSVTISGAPLLGLAPLEVSFSAVIVGLPGGVTHDWYLGEGPVVHDAAPKHTYTEPGVYQAKLVARYNGGASGRLSNTLVIVVAEPPNAPPVVGWIADPPTDTSFGETTVTFAAVGRDGADEPSAAVAIDPDGDAEVFEWFVDGVEVTGQGGSLLWIPPDHQAHDIEVRVTDGGGLTDSYSAPYRLRQPRLTALDMAVELGEDAHLELEAAPGQWAIVLSSRRPWQGGDYDGTPLALHQNWFVFAGPFEVDEDGLVEVVGPILDFPDEYAFQAVVAADPDLLDGRVVSTTARITLLPAECDPGEMCFSGRLRVREMAYDLRYDADPAPGMQCEEGQELIDTNPDTAGGERCVEFVDRDLPLTRIQIYGVDGTDLIPVTPIAYTDASGFFAIPGLPEAQLYPSHLIRVWSESAHSRVVFGNHLFFFHGTTVSYADAYDCSRFDAFRADCGLEGAGMQDLTFGEFLATVAQEVFQLVLEETNVVQLLQASVDFLKIQWEAARDLLLLAFDIAINTAKGELQLLGDLLKDTGENIVDFFKCLDDCPLWKWALLICPIECAIQGTIEELQDLFDFVKGQIQIFKDDLQLLKQAIPIVRDWIQDDLAFLKDNAELLWEEYLLEDSILGKRLLRLKKLQDLYDFALDFIGYIAFNPGQCSGPCPNLIFELLGVPGVIERILDSRFYKIFGPERHVRSVYLRDDPAPPSGSGADFGLVVIRPDPNPFFDEEYQEALQFTSLMERVERSYATISGNSPRFASRTQGNDGIAELVFPNTQGSFYWGYDFDRNGLTEISIAPEDALEDTVMHEYGHFVHEKLLDFPVLPIPWTLGDFTRRHTICAEDNPDDYSREATFSEGFANFIIHSTAGWPSTYGRSHEFDGEGLALDSSMRPCTYLGEREEFWAGRIMWELWDGKGPTVRPGIHPGILSYDEIIRIVSDDSFLLGHNPPTTICEFYYAVVGSGYLQAGEIAVVRDIFKRNTIEPGPTDTFVAPCSRPEDRDSDGHDDDVDNCIGVANPTQLDTDGDGVGDACDNCPAEPNETQDDENFDGIGDECNGDLIVDITAAPLDGTAPVAVNFQSSIFDHIPGPHTYAWDFAGEGVSAAPNPNFNFTTAGDHVVTLVVTNDDDGRSGSASVTIEVELPITLFGDMNGDDSADISDAMFLLSALFMGGPQPLCRDCADLNGDARIDVSDVVFLLIRLFRATPR